MKERYIMKDKTISIDLTERDINWLYQATKKEYAYYLKYYGNEKFDEFTSQIFKIYNKFHNLNKGKFFLKEKELPQPFFN